jgi:hypothetical protein
MTKMKKPRSDSKCFGLSRPQLAQLEAWLFVDNLGYKDALAKARAEFGFQGSISSIQRFYTKRARERLPADLPQTAHEAKEVTAAPANEQLPMDSAMKQLGHRFYRQMKEAEKMDPAAVGALLLQSQANEIRRQENEIRLAAQALRRERLEFDKKNLRGTSGQSRASADFRPFASLRDPTVRRDNPTEKPA